jgi:Ribosomal protein L6e
LGLLQLILSITGPFKVNGVPLKRVNQAYVLATSTKVNISSVDVSKFEDEYFMKQKKKKKTKKTEGEFFKSDEEVFLFSFLSVCRVKISCTLSPMWEFTKLPLCWFYYFLCCII